MDVLKNLGGAAETVAAEAVTEAELELIHRFTRRKLGAEEVYTFGVKLCDNEIDRDGERFSAACLEGLKGLFVGKTGIFDHSGKTEDQVMRIFDCSVERDESRKTSVGEVYTALCARVYLLRCEGNTELIRGIDAGIKKEVSVSCAVKKVTCSVCGKAFGKEGCTHRKGVGYGGAACHAVLDEPTDAYEFSFVAVPAQPAAGVLKRRKAKADAAQAAYIEDLERLAEDGRLYRAELMEKTLKAGAAAMPGFRKELLRAMCTGLQTQQLRDLHEDLSGRAARSLPLCPQLQKTMEQGQDRDSYRV